MVGQATAEPTLVRPTSHRDQRQTCPEDLQGSRNFLHKISTEPTAPVDGLQPPLIKDGAEANVERMHSKASSEWG